MVHNINHIVHTESTHTSQEVAPDRPHWLAAATGLNAALAITYLACKPPQSHTLSWTARFLTSALYLLVACSAGAAGTWIALPRSSRAQYRKLVLWGARGWVFLPAVMMFLRQRSIQAPLLAAIAAAVMATYLVRFIDPPANQLAENAKPHGGVENIFTTQISIGPTSWIPFGISLCLYGALTSAANGKLSLVTLLFSLAIFLLVPQIIAAAQKIAENSEEAKERTHPYALLAMAFFCSVLALSVSAAGSDFDIALRAFQLQERAHASPRTTEHHPGGPSSAGYRTIVLLPIQKKEKVIPSPPQSSNPSSRHSSKPWIIPFYGPYLYFQTTSETSGPKTDIAHGDSLKVNVHSTDREPLLMEAHQTLPDPVDMDCCREIQVVLKNDLSLGASEVGLSLTDSRSRGKMSQNLGIKYVSLDGTAQRVGDAPFVEETLRFPLPKFGKIKKFDQITVILFPDPKHLTAGRKVAVERFIMIPN